MNVASMIPPSAAEGSNGILTGLCDAGQSWPVNHSSYKLLGKVGQGAFASVWRAECVFENKNTVVVEEESNQNEDETSTATATATATATSQLEGGFESAGSAGAHVPVPVPVQIPAPSSMTEVQVGSQIPQTSQEKNGTGQEGGQAKEKTLLLHESNSCAIKILDLEHVDTNFGDIRLEVQTMRLSSHPNILSIYTSFIQSSNLWLVMPLMDKGSSIHCLQSIRMKYHKYNYNSDLATCTTNTNINTSTNTDTNANTATKQEIIMENHITYILHETLLGLKYIHENGQIHRDIKAGNILLDSFGNVRIADFGVSGWLVHGGSKRENTRTFVGTPCWMAPEVMEQITGYDTKADIWSLGITALELAKGYAPYAKYPPMKVLMLTIQEDPPSMDTYLNYDDYDEDDGAESDVVMNEEWSQSFQSMIKMCLQKKPDERPSSSSLLQHEHFRPLADEATRNEYRQKIKAEICDEIENVGTSSQTSHVGRQSGNQTCDEPITVMASETVPEGTTWIFQDGSHVSSSQIGGSAENDDDQDFFDKFERETQGENFRHPSISGSRDNDATVKRNQHDKDDLNAFMDEFENLTSGEHFKK